MKKGFTLIELLIVIAIIGILAVAFLPSLLGGTSDARDAARQAALQKIQKGLLNAYVRGDISTYPAMHPTGVLNFSNGCINGGGSHINLDTAVPGLTATLGGEMPSDPQGAIDIAYGTYSCTGAAQGSYFYVDNPGNTGAYAFGLFAKMENYANANMNCRDTIVLGNPQTAIPQGDPTRWCYGILVPAN